MAGTCCVPAPTSRCSNCFSVAPAWRSTICPTRSKWEIMRDESRARSVARGHDPAREGRGVPRDGDFAPRPDGLRWVPDRWLTDP